MTDAASSETILTTNSALKTILYRRGVKHDANRGTEGLGGERVAELSTDNTGVAYRIGR